MPTPSSGAISMNDMRTEINRATTSSISMSEMRDRYGGSGSISFSDLRNCEGMTVTCGAYRTKFLNYDGWLPTYSIGSVSPDEGGGRVSFAANSWLSYMYVNTVSPANTICLFNANSTSLTVNGDQITAGYKTTSVTRFVAANVSRTIQAATSNSTSSFITVGYATPNTGTIHCLFKFS